MDLLTLIVFNLIVTVQSAKYINEDLTIDGNYCINETLIICNNTTVEIDESANITVSSKVNTVFINRGILSLSGTIHLLGNKTKRQVILVDGSYVNFSKHETIVGPKECNINVRYSADNQCIVNLCYPLLGGGAIAGIIACTLLGSMGIFGVLYFMIAEHITAKRIYNTVAQSQQLSQQSQQHKVNSAAA